MVFLQLFWSFLQIGYTSFGGNSMVPLINSEMVSHGWMETREVADIVAIAEMTPGPLGLNCATFAGMRVAGILGALVANLGVLTPTFTLCAVAAFFFEKFRKSRTLENVLFGVRPVSIAIVCAVILSLSVDNFTAAENMFWIPLIIGGVSCLLLLKYKLSVPKVIAVSAALGLLLCR